MKTQANKYYPTHLVHGFLAAHIGDETGSDAGNSLIKEGDSVKFSGDNALYRYFQDNKKLDINDFITDWEALTVIEDEQSGYLGIVYCNNMTQQLVLAHRSTNFALAFSSKIFLRKQSGMQADFDGALKGILTRHQEYAYKATKEALELANRSLYNNYSFSTTGHSLGSWLAELSVFYANTEFSYNLKGITFDGPGSFEMMKQLSKSNIKGVGSNFKIKHLDIISYFSAPNVVNCSNKHVGDAYRLFPEIPPDDYPEWLESFLKTVGYDAAISTFGHHMKYILPHFDIESGKPIDCRKVIKWPSITHNHFSPLGSETTSFGSLCRLIKYWMKKQIDLTQFWSVHEYIDRSKRYGIEDGAQSEEFGVLYKANYKVVSLNNHTRKISDNVDKELVELSRVVCFAKEMSMGDSPLLKTIKDINAIYKVKNKEIIIEKDYKDKLDIHDLRDKAREFIHKNKENYEELKETIEPAYEIFKHKPEIVEITKYLSYFAADEEIPLAVLNNLFTKEELVTAKAALQSITNSNVFKIPEMIQYHVRSHFKLDLAPDQEVVHRILKIINSFMPSITEKPNDSKEETKLYVKHAQNIMRFCQNETDISELNIKLGLFHKYVEENDEKALEYFIDALKGKIDEHNMNLLHVAIVYVDMPESLEIVKLFSSKQPSLINSVNKNGETVLHYAVKKCSQEMCEFLIPKMNLEIVEAVDKEGKTAWSLAKTIENEELYKLVLTLAIKKKIEEGDRVISNDHDQVILVIGKTGAGKSTLVNYLTNPENLEVVRHKNPANKFSKLGNLVIDLKNLAKTHSPKIGHKKDSETSLPNKWQSANGKLVYWDCPGFEDTNGPVQEISNAFYIKKIFDTTKNIKLVLVMDSSDLNSTRANDIRKLSNTLGSLFNQDKSVEVIKGLSLVVTKADKAIDIDNIKEEIYEILQAECFKEYSKGKEILSSLILPKADQDTFDSLIDERFGGDQAIKSRLEPLLALENKIAIFKKAEREGDVIEVLDDNEPILKIINNTEFIREPEVQITVSDETRSLIADLAASAEKTLQKNINSLTNDIRNFYSLKFGELKSQNAFEALRDLQDNLVFLLQTVITSDLGTIESVLTSFGEGLSGRLLQLPSFVRALNKDFQYINFFKQIKHDLVLQDIRTLFEKFIDLKNDVLKYTYLSKERTFKIQGNLITDDDINTGIKKYFDSNTVGSNVSTIVPSINAVEIYAQELVLHNDLSHHKLKGLNLSIMGSLQDRK